MSARYRVLKSIYNIKKKGYMNHTISLKEECEFEGNMVTVSNYKCFPIYSQARFKTIQGFLERDSFNYDTYRIKPECSDSKQVLQSYSGILFVVKPNSHQKRLMVRDMDGIFSIEDTFLDNLEAVNITSIS